MPGVDSGDAPTRDTAAPDPASDSGEPAGSAEATQHIAWPETDAETTQQVSGSGSGSGSGSDEDTVVTAAASTPLSPGTSPDTASETTQFIPSVPADDPPPHHLTAALPAQGAAAGPAGTGSGNDGTDPGDTGDDERGESRLAALGKARKPLLIAAAVFGVLALVYVVDVFATSGDVPRGTVVAGVEVGGMSRADAEEKLRSELEPRMTQPVQYRAGDVEDEFDPQQAGLRLNWKETLDRAGDQPLNPFSRIASLFTEREVDVATETERNQLENALVSVQETVDREPVEGTIEFEGADPKAVEPKNGQKLDVSSAENVITRDWADGKRIALPVDSTPVSVSAQDVQKMLRDVAEPAVSAPVLVRGEGADGTLEPEEIAAALSFTPESGTLTPKIDRKKMVEGVQEELSSTVQKGRDAEIVFEGGSPTVKPSKDGKHIKWKETFQPLMDVLQRDQQREIKAEYEKQEAETTTKEAKQLGVKEVIGEFTTGDFAADSGVNIRRVAEEVNGAIVKPGETFSLNQHTGPRTKAQGYVEAGIIEDGAPGKAVGGGISQFATTLYNASYFAGMTDAGHQEHSYYISRYPEGREATVFQNSDGSSIIDLAFTNNLPNGVAIQTEWTPNDITIRLWGTKKYDVQSRTGERTDVVKPKTKKGPEGEDCSPSEGAPGFTVTDTRVLRDLDSGSVNEETRTVRYNPQPKIVCGNNRP
ncbi:MULTISPECIES: VanW family protein [Prauserella salsuginis group]|uniref:VanW family protein n=1 Tax=Prauserella salsuginis TaxID=387889 RepID=A0ABW6G504_9PSEU|nr:MULTISPECIES: VanW family protein [Prauserella salsuginis group]MCR3718826.1 Vancomycin resistance protein YoaR, contains peptidoglycan-binding and VanW domains [Prauserella flava]MCR3733396.1 Vancomycin resistance protein YoaR, contains peptidoglycan-binding and VanW domains [Prauserella salsuginis]